MIEGPRKGSRLSRGKEMFVWQRWLQHPESVWVRKAFFQIHLWAGIATSLYVVFISVSGSLVVFRPQLERRYPISLPSVEWLVNLHANLLSGQTGRYVNGVGAIGAVAMCLTGAIIWWPGISRWRRSLTVDWRGHAVRVSWDLHSALGFWCFIFVLLWGLSGFYLCFPQTVSALFGFLDPGNKFTVPTLYWLSALHFGRFGWFAEMVWAFLGLVPAILAVTGILLSWHRYRRVIFKIPPLGTMGPTRNS
jgi:uncharacterized iron-regulated membrane protein